MGRLLAATIGLALLTTALPGSVAVAENQRACKVTNLDSGRKHVNFQRAVWHAQPGDHLQVVGTCRGTAIVRKPLRISGDRVRWTFYGQPTSPGPSPKNMTRRFDSGPPRLIGKNGRPALVISPNVDRLSIAPNVTVVHGLVIGDPDHWLDPSSTIAAEWHSWTEPPDQFVRKCGPGGGLAARVVAASPGATLGFLGTCWGPVRIEVDMAIAGDGWEASSAPLGHPERAVTSASGRPMIKRRGFSASIIVDPSVDQLTLEGFRIHDGLRIGEGVN